MAIQLGSTNFGSIYLGSTKIGEAYLGSVKVFGSAQPDPYNPLNLPAYTMRFQFDDTEFDPNTVSEVSWPSGATWTKVTSETYNVWDFHYANPIWEGVGITGGNYSIFASLSFDASHGRYTIKGANTRGVTSMKALFSFGWLYYIAHAFDTSAVTDTTEMFYGVSDYAYRQALPSDFDFSHAQHIESMFAQSNFYTIPDYDFSGATGSISYLCDYCRSLIGVPNFTFNVNSLTNVSYAFRMCEAVESGALDMYNKLSASSSITTHSYTFGSCGSGSVAGRAELSHIPPSWGGTMREYQNDYYFQISSYNNYNQLVVRYPRFNDSLQSISSGQANDDGWTAISTSDINALNGGSACKQYGTGLRFFFTKDADPSSFLFWASRNDSYVPSVACEVTLYGKRVGSNSWTSIAHTTYTQGNDVLVSVY